MTTPLRQIVLDTETTGLDPKLGHRIIEIGCIEMKHRRATGKNFHRFMNPDRAIDAGAQAVHGISAEFLSDKPRFHELAEDLWKYLEGAELLIHNAAFDMGFLEAEYARAGFTARLSEVCRVTDTVAMARQKHPGQKNSLDALCDRYSVDRSRREFHGALLDAQLLADVYLAMTGGQDKLLLDNSSGDAWQSKFLRELGACSQPLPVVLPTEAELVLHREKLAKIGKKSPTVWQGEG